VRFALFLLLVGAAAAAARWTALGDLLTREAVLALLGDLRQAWWSPLLLIGLYVVLCPLGLPATPLMVGGGVVFGAALGSLYNLAGTLLGAVVSYYLADHLGSELVGHFARGRLKRVERLAAGHGFWFLVGMRFLPLPFPAVNFGLALAGIRPLPFILSTAAGLAPSIPLWTYFWASLYQAAAGERADLVRRLAAVVFALAFVSLLPALIRRRLWRRRYRRLKAARAARRGRSAGPASVLRSTGTGQDDPLSGR
jgi:uncharacterized membrane protein YdjX (TVP38/TMEM64 family)